MGLTCYLLFGSNNLLTRANTQEQERRSTSHAKATTLPFPLQGWIFRAWGLERWDFPSLAFSLLPFLVCLTVLGSQPAGRTYGPSHWFATYEHGFLRRALVGEIFSGMGFLSWHSIHLMNAAVVVMACLLTGLAFRRILFGRPAERRFAAFLLAAPAFLPHMAYMDGELDNFLYLAILVGAFALMRLGNLHGLFIATGCTVLGLLMHEAFALMFYPLVLVLAADLVHRGKLKSGWVAAHVVVVFAVFVSVVHFGKLSGTPAEWIVAAQRRTDMRVDGTVFLVLQCSLREQLSFVRHLYTPQVIGSILLTLALSVPYGIVLWRLVRTACILREYSAAHTRLVLLIFAAPLALSLLGHDVMRWVSALCINVSLYLLLVYHATPRGERSGRDLHKALTGWTGVPAYAATLLYLLALGPWGIAGNRLLSNAGKLLGR
jgi:hypothetical protein